MIDEFRKQIQDRLDQLVSEVDRLRRALVALGGGERSGPADAARHPTRARTADHGGATAMRRRSTARSDSGSASAASGGSASSDSSASVRQTTPGRSTGQPSKPRAAQGQTRNAVLAALSSGEAMTAGEVAAATGLGRASVSTTLSKLAKSGDVEKADRGYRRSEPSSAA